MGGSFPFLTIGIYLGCGVLALVVGFGAIKRPDFNIVPRRRRFRQVVVPGMIVPEVVEFLRRPVRGYQLYQVDVDRGLVVWAEGPSYFSLGAFYPLYVDPTHQGVMVTCAIEPRVPLLDPFTVPRLRRLQRTVIAMVGGTAV